uniref:Uncharacterized protein n=1 Tax=Pogona vitticeps TaxID=103695 RepID=A0A6J0SMH1_9SAUR
MDEITYHAYLVFSIMVQAVPLQATGYLPLRNEDMPGTITIHEARDATSSVRTEITSVINEVADNTIMYNASVNSNQFATTVNTTAFSTLLIYFAQSSHSSHVETNTSSSTIADTKNEVTTLPTESATFQATVKDVKVTTSFTTSNMTVQPSRSVPLISSKVLFSVSANQFPAEPAHLKNSEVILTILFAIVLVLTILGFTLYILKTYRKWKEQYVHHPLCDTSSETVDRYTAPDDTLVISGGLYDAPRICNSNMMVYKDDELQNDSFLFNIQPQQLRLEFLPGEKENDFSSMYETFQIPPGGL